MTEQFEKRPHLQGFTIVEVVAVLVVIAILALVVGSRVGGTDTARLSSRTGDIVSKLRYAHLRAIKSGTPWGVSCDATDLWLFHGTDPTDVTLRERFPGENDKAVNLAAKEMTLTSFTVIFDGYGIPYVSYTDESNNIKVDDLVNTVQTSVGFPGGGATRTVGVTPETGFTTS
ncbi:prepilin-type N-terminal cleavage/methylation domain-containing protein [Salidesulfovibrio brasiliensis]